MNIKSSLSHIAFIMDGNGRWGVREKSSRLEGHIEGAINAKVIIDSCLELRIPYVTLFAFSMDNWKRPEDEVIGIFEVFKSFAKKYDKEFIHKKINIRLIGNINTLPEDAQDIVHELGCTSVKDPILQLNIAINYSGKWDIINAIKKINEKNEEVSEILIKNNLSTSDQPDPDLIIRTSGEKRLSNFMLWQSSYSELYFSSKPWPEFSQYDLIQAINEYESKKRRYGGI